MKYSTAGCASPGYVSVASSRCSHSGLSQRVPPGTSTVRTDKASDQCGDLICSGVQCEMTGVENVNLGVRNILPVALRLAEVEGEVILTPDHQQLRLLLAHPSLPLGVGVDVRAVVVKEVALNVCLVGLVEKGKFIGPEIRVVAFDVGIVPDMTRSG